MSGQTAGKLAYMAGQIARNLAHEDNPASATAAHIHAFWTPTMIAALKAEAPHLDLPAAVAAALDQL